MAEHDGTILILNFIMEAAVLFLWILCSSSCQRKAWEKASLCLREFQPDEYHMISGDTWYPIAPDTPLCPAQGHSVKLEMLQVLERNFFVPLEQDNVSTMPQI